MVFFYRYVLDVLGSARNVIKGTSLYFNGRIRYGTKGEKVDERLLVKKIINKEFDLFVFFHSVWMQLKFIFVRLKFQLKYDLDFIKNLFFFLI